MSGSGADGRRRRLADAIMSRHADKVISGGWEERSMDLAVDAPGGGDTGFELLHVDALRF